MINKNSYLENLKTAQDISKKYIINNISEKMYSLIEEIEDFKVKVLFVGSFNAGKSALINVFIDEDLLQEEQMPETTIATELVYGEPRRVVLFDKQGNNKSISIDDIVNYNASEYFNYTYYIPSENLLNISNYVIVDMPGFDSGIDAHNKALLQYLGLGTAYIFVIDCEKGVLSQSALNFIKEIKSYHNKIAFVINKCDKKALREIDDIKNRISEQATAYLGEEVKVITTSKFDEDAQEKLEDIINSFNGQELFERKYTSEIIDNLKNIILALDTILSSSQLDIKEFDEEIVKKESAKVSLINKLSCERKKLHNNLQNNVKASLLNDLRNALYSNSSVLASSAVAGGENFSRSVNDIIRPVLMKKTRQYIEDSFSDFVTNFRVNEVMPEENTEFIREILSSLNNKLKNFTKNTSNENKLYKSITTILAVTTSVVSPWIEVILIFLPEIMQIFSKLSESNQVDAFKNKIENEVIPSILAKIEPNVEQSLMDIEAEMSIEIENQINSLIEIETQALEEIKRKKENEEEEYKNMLKDIEKDIDIIKDLMKKIMGGY